MRTSLLNRWPSPNALSLLLMSVVGSASAVSSLKDETSAKPLSAASQAEADEKVRAIASEIRDAQDMYAHGIRHAAPGSTPHAPNALKAYLFDTYDRCDPGKVPFIRLLGQDDDFNRNVAKALLNSKWPTWSGDARDDEQLIVILSESHSNECRSPYIVVAARSVGMRVMRRGFILPEDIDPFIRAVRSELNSAYYDRVFWETNTEKRLGYALSERPAGPMRPRSMWLFVSPAMARLAANSPAIMDAPSNVLRPRPVTANYVTFEVYDIKYLSDPPAAKH
jgi:hypothetical protein